MDYLDLIDNCIVYKSYEEIISKMKVREISYEYDS